LEPREEQKHGSDQKEDAAPGSLKTIFVTTAPYPSAFPRSQLQNDAQHLWDNYFSLTCALHAASSLRFFLSRTYVSKISISDLIFSAGRCAHGAFPSSSCPSPAIIFQFLLAEIIFLEAQKIRLA
jgi:hypothetical protein